MLLDEQWDETVKVILIVVTENRAISRAVLFSRLDRIRHFVPDRL